MNQHLPWQHIYSCARRQVNEDKSSLRPTWPTLAQRCDRRICPPFAIRVLKSVRVFRAKHALRPPYPNCSHVGGEYASQEHNSPRGSGAIPWSFIHRRTDRSHTDQPRHTKQGEYFSESAPLRPANIQRQLRCLPWIRWNGKRTCSAIFRSAASTNESRLLSFVKRISGGKTRSDASPSAACKDSSFL